MTRGVTQTADSLGQEVQGQTGLWKTGGESPGGTDGGTWEGRAGRSVQCAGLQDTYGVEELGGEAQVVMERQEGDPLQPDHDDLREMGALVLTSPRHLRCQR